MLNILHNLHESYEMIFYKTKIKKLTVNAKLFHVCTWLISRVHASKNHHHVLKRLR